MNSECLISDFLELIKKHTLPNSTMKSGVEIKFTVDNTQANLNLVNELFNDSDIIKNNVTVNLSKCKINNCYFFYDIKDYLIGYDKYKDNYTESHIIVLNYNESFIWKKNNDEFSKDKALFFNFPIYKELYLFLKDNPLFTTLYGDIKRELIIVSKDNGTIHIGCKDLEERVALLDDLNPLFDLLVENFKKKEFAQFFKENITVFGIGNFDSQDRFYQMIKNLKPILLLTERDYENYVLDFNFEKIKTKFKEERNKYFEGLEKNIELVSKQVLSIPLTFAATIFASYQVKEKPFIVLLILFGFILYTVIAYKMLEISKFNVKCIKVDVEKEEKAIKNNYLKNHSHFKSDFKKIYLKISKINNLIYCIKWVLGLMLFLFISFSAFQFFSNVETKKENIITPSHNVKNKSIDTIIQKQSRNKVKTK